MSPSESTRNIGCSEQRFGLRVDFETSDRGINGLSSMRIPPAKVPQIYPNGREPVLYAPFHYFPKSTRKAPESS